MGGITRMMAQTALVNKQGQAIISVNVMNKLPENKNDPQK